ncbi:hypothetical protein HZH66_008498 [Vespula vulgaris]|uniref:Uncharacterized protein n=1 Tax=Vespula vulgaris TaxID=7454 RepID=A0A834JRA5_VESVU|nr:hypothetical protein HZH66_008498 [Vespula vulgaris]
MLLPACNYTKRNKDEIEKKDVFFTPLSPSLPPPSSPSPPPPPPPPPPPHLLHALYPPTCSCSNDEPEMD